MRAQEWRARLLPGLGRTAEVPPCQGPRRRASRLLRSAVSVGVATALAVQAQAADSERGVQAIARAITELDVARAHELLTAMTVESPGLAFQRARLAVYVGDCDSASATLAGLEQNPETHRLAELAGSCAGATAGALVVEDEGAGVWIRFQDHQDRVLAPLLVEVAVKARETMALDLGVELPRPLRIDLVRDLFS